MILEATDKQPVTTGRAFYVMASTDPGYADFLASHDPYIDGVAKVYGTVADAYAAAVTNRDDVIYISGYSAHALTEMLTVSKSRVHFEGMGAVSGRKNSQAARIEIATAVATDVAVIRNTGTRNTYRNLKIVQNGTDTACTSAFIDEGEGTFMEYCNCQVNTIVSTVAQALLFAGDTCHYKDCQFGTATVYRTAASGNTILIAISNGAYPRYSYFENCTIISYSSQTTTACVRCTMVIGWIKFENCAFINALKGDGATAGGAMAEAIVTTSTAGYLMLDNRCVSFNAAKIAEADAYILNASGVAVAAARGGEAIAGA